jgi:CBS domain containing-hemolysin-like protein
MQESAQSLTTDERTLINRVLDLQNLTVRTVTIPMSEAKYLLADTSVEEVFQLARDSSYSRFPVLHKPGGKVVGVLNLSSLLYDPKLSRQSVAGDHARRALYLPEHLRLEEALRRMQRSGRRLAIVLGRNEREVGIVTLQDILKVIFGAN